MEASCAVSSLTAFRKDPRHGSVPERCQTCPAQYSCAFTGMPEFHGLAERRFYGRGYTVLQQGSEAKRAYVLRSGWIQTTHVTPEGKAIVNLAGPGALLGFQEVLSGARHTAGAQTLEDSEIESVEAARLFAFLEDYPAAALALLKTLSAQWERSLSRLYDLASKVPADRRLVRALCEISRTCGCESEGGIRIKVPVSIQMLADIIGCSRQWISTLLAELEERGILRHKSGWITLYTPAFGE